MADEIQRIGVDSFGGAAPASGLQVTESNINLGDMWTALDNWDGRLTSDPIGDQRAAESRAVAIAAQTDPVAAERLAQSLQDQYTARAAQYNQFRKMFPSIPLAQIPASITAGLTIDQAGNVIMPRFGPPPLPPQTGGTFMPVTPSAPPATTTAAPVTAPAPYLAPVVPVGSYVRDDETEARIVQGQNTAAPAIAPAAPASSRGGRFTRAPAIVPTLAALALPDADPGLVAQMVDQLEGVDQTGLETTASVVTVSPEAVIVSSPTQIGSTGLDQVVTEPASVSVTGGTSGFLGDAANDPGELLGDTIFADTDLGATFDSELLGLPDSDTLDFALDQEAEDGGLSLGDIAGGAAAVAGIVKGGKEIADAFDDDTPPPQPPPAAASSSTINPLYVVAGVVVLYLLLRRK